MMRRKMYRMLRLCAAALICAAHAQSIFAQAQRPAAPRVFLIDARKLAETKRAILDGDKSYDAALRKLENEARKALDAGAFSVVTKAVTPPSGDKHDYMSQAPYFWPDPKRA